jgi:hypothetical protein
MDREKLDEAIADWLRLECVSFHSLFSPHSLTSEALFSFRSSAEYVSIVSQSTRGTN